MLINAHQSNVAIHNIRVRWFAVNRLLKFSWHYSNVSYITSYIQFRPWSTSLSSVSGQVRTLSKTGSTCLLEKSGYHWEMQWIQILGALCVTILLPMFKRLSAFVAVFELRKNKWLSHGQSRYNICLLYVQVFGCPYMEYMCKGELWLRIYGCPSDNCISDFFSCPGRTDNRNFERCFVGIQIPGACLCNNMNNFVCSLKYSEVTILIR